MLPFESMAKPQGMSGSLAMTHALNWADAGGTATTRNPPQPIKQNRTVRSVPLCNADLSMFAHPFPDQGARCSRVSVQKTISSPVACDSCPGRNVGAILYPRRYGDCTRMTGYPEVVTVESRRFRSLRGSERNRDFSTVVVTVHTMA